MHTSDHAQSEYNSHKLLLNLLEAILFPKSLDVALLCIYTAIKKLPVKTRSEIPESTTLSD